jgi:dTDP-glucose pyrophosphorylase
VSGPLVCILAAGTGSRLRFADGALHKALVPVGGRAVISRVMDQFSPDTRFVVALGHQGDQVADYLSIAHPDRSIETVRVQPYVGPGSGPGRSLACCAELLDGPFVLTAVDTLVERVPELGSRSWIGVAPVADPERWCTVETAADGTVTALHERLPEPRPAFVGIAWITRPDLFIAGLSRNDGSGPEHQVTPGFEALVRSGTPLEVREVAWQDTGSPDTYARTYALHAGGALPEHDADDVTYVEPPRVIKWFRDPEAAARRIARGAALRGVVPTPHAAPPGWLVRDFVEGEPLRGLDERETAALLEWAEQQLWRALPRDAGFEADCRAFYLDKTLARLARHLAREGSPGEEPAIEINGRPTRPVAEMLAETVGELVDAAVPSTFHGDLHEGNIIRTAGGYRLIDWRDAFGSSAERGDRLYDLAKLLHTLELPEREMAKGSFVARWACAGRVRLEQPDTPERRAARARLWSHCRERGYPERALGLVDALVFVNMAPLYDERLGEYLYLLGRWLLAVSAAASDGAARERELASGFRPREAVG